MAKQGPSKPTDEEVTPTRAKVREIFEGKIITTIMSTVTLYALFGDDIRFWFTTKSSDLYMDIALIFSLFAFSIEILVNSCVVDDFKYSFFFWLDIIATISIIPDIMCLINPLQEMVFMVSDNQSADAMVG